MRNVSTPRGRTFRRTFDPFYTGLIGQSGSVSGKVNFWVREHIAPKQRLSEVIALNEEPGWSPEQRLAAAVIVRGVKDLEHEAPHVRREARRWFEGFEGDHEFSFERCATYCDREPLELLGILISRGLFDA